MSFESLGLRAELLRAVAEKGYNKATPIQQQAIPLILEGRDIMGGAQTGTGKTAGFTLPLLQRLMSSTQSETGRRPIRALVLTPTRELAAQVAESVETYGRYLPLRSAVVFGGVSINPQKIKLIKGVDILVATPGRLLDHVGQNSANLSKIEILVLDEADRMLDMGFIRDIRKVLSLLPRQKQTLLFSATFSDEIKKLANQILNVPVLIEVAKRNSINDLITHVVYDIKSSLKSELLVYLIKQKHLNQALIFNRTKSGADRLTKYLDQQGISVAVIHGDKNQLERCQAFNDFKQGSIQALVATDVAARGLDIEELTCVINFELPNNPEDYIHRIGRTGRAGAKGYAISLVSPEEKKLLAGIEKLLQKKITIERIAKFEEDQIQNNSSKGKNSQQNKITKDSLLKKDNATIAATTRTEATRFNAKRVSRDNKSRVASKDPLFTQPYISADSGVKLEKDFDVGQAPLSHRKRRYRTKTIPALFIPPVSK